MYKVICDIEGCTNEELIGSIYTRPTDWMELSINTYASSGVTMKKSYCPSCSENMAIFNRSETKEKRKDNLEEIIRDIVQEEVQEYMNAGARE